MADGHGHPQRARPRPLKEEEARRLGDVLEITASVRARELRVDEARGIETSEGQTTTRRVGLPRTGAVPGVTYRNVRVAVTVQGRSQPNRPAK